MSVEEAQLDSLRVELRALQDGAAVLRLLFETPGWKLYQDFMDEQVRTRRNILESAVVSGMDAVLENSHLLAELNGLRIGAEYGPQALSALEDQIEGLTEMLTKETENQSEEL